MSGRYPGAVWLPSPNVTRGRALRVDRVVVHITDGRDRLDRAVAHLRNPEPSGGPGRRVSAHFVVGRGGEVAQLVDLGDTAWHASGWNGRSVGIEHVARTPGELGRDDAGMQLTPEQLAASAALVRWICAELGIPADAEHVVPHCSVPGTTHADCGRDVADGGIWPWPEYLAMLAGGDGVEASP